MTRRTKIVATIGPSVSTPEALDELLAAGVDVVRLNLSHGPVDEHLARLAAVREAAARVGRVVGILADLPGPKVRAGRFPDAGAVLVEGADVLLAAGDGDSSAERITVGYPTLLDDVDPGDRVVLGDGAPSLRVARVDRAAGCVACTVENGGRTMGRPGVHLPSERFRLSAPTPDDLVLAKTLADAGADFIGVSFVRRAIDVQRVREAIAPAAAHVVAKIETMGAIDDLPAIVDAADAVMVARGDLGIEWPLEDVPHLQKQIIGHCVAAGVPVITATQMLESMIHAPAPTRAEVSDVANAVFDGTDAVMLSGETAIGDHPALVVRTMARIAERAERDGAGRAWAAPSSTAAHPTGWIADPVTDAITHAAWQAAEELSVAAIICSTRRGGTARAMARFRPRTPLLGMSPDPATVRTLSVVWGVRPIEVGRYDSTDAVVDHTVDDAVRRGFARSGEHVLVLAGAPGGTGDTVTDVLRIVRIP